MGADVMGSFMTGSLLPPIQTVSFAIRIIRREPRGLAAFRWLFFWLCRISYGLTRHMWIDLREVELPGNEEDHRANGRDRKYNISRERPVHILFTKLK